MSARRSTARAPRLFRRHVSRGPENHALLRSSRGVIVGEFVRSAILAADSEFERLGKTEVQDLHGASGVTLTLAGFRSRWTIPRSCAASSASTIWPAIVSASVNRDRPALMRPRASALRPAPSPERVCPDPRGRELFAMLGLVERGQEPRFALEAGHALCVAARMLRARP